MNYLLFSLEIFLVFSSELDSLELSDEELSSFFVSFFFSELDSSLELSLEEDASFIFASDLLEESSLEVEESEESSSFVFCFFASVSGSPVRLRFLLFSLKKENISLRSLSVLSSTSDLIFVSFFNVFRVFLNPASSRNL